MVPVYDAMAVRLPAMIPNLLAVVRPKHDHPRRQSRVVAGSGPGELCPGRLGNARATRRRASSQMPARLSWLRQRYQQATPQ
jgi:hypothetical protein